MLLGYWHWWTNLSRAVIKKEEYFLKRCWLVHLSVYSILKYRCNFLYQGLVPSFGYLALPPPQWICETSIANTRTKKLISMVLWLDTLSSVYPLKIKCVHLKLWVIRLLIVRQLISENYQSRYEQISVLHAQYSKFDKTTKKSAHMYYIGPKACQDKILVYLLRDHWDIGHAWLFAERGVQNRLFFFFRQPGKSGHVTNIRLAKSRKNTNYHVTSLRRTKGL